MNCTDAFPKTLKKKIEKTAEARTGKGIYKRRNNRNYRVIMQLTTYINIINNNPNILNQYENGYVVRLKPHEYFNEDGSRKNTVPASIELGENAFIYFKTKSDYNKYFEFCKEDDGSTWEEVVELHTCSEETDEKTWRGKYCCFICNSDPQIISTICQTKNSATVLQQLKIKYGVEKIPQQAGLGNFDYDYANTEMIKKIQYQMSYLIWSVEGMKDYIIGVFNSTPNNELSKAQRKHKEEGTLSNYIDTVITHTTNFCRTNGLLDFNRLAQARIWDLNRNCVICPLCKQSLTPELFFKTTEQDQGRQEEDNTQAEIAFMHIEALKPGKLNNTAYNLGWGHQWCNTVQGPASIAETLEKIKNILEENEEA